MDIPIILKQMLVNMVGKVDCYWEAASGFQTALNCTPKAINCLKNFLSAWLWAFKQSRRRYQIKWESAYTV